MLVYRYPRCRLDVDWEPHVENDNDNDNDNDCRKNRSE
jgi:hypothetical protein